MIIRIITLILCFIFIIVGSLSAAPNFTLLQIGCDGKVLKSSIYESVLMPSTIKDNSKTACGKLHEFNFYDICLSENNEEILASTDLLTSKRTELLDIKSKIDKDHVPAYIGYVDDDWILFSAYYLVDEMLSRWPEKKVQLYEFDRKNNTLKKLPIDGIQDYKFSVLNDRIYYTGEDGAIFENFNGTSKDLGVIGWGVSISPDGHKLAFRKTGILREGVYVLDLRNMRTKSIIKFFGHNSINPILRWSNNSRLLAIHKSGDLGSSPLYVIDVSNQKILNKFEKNRACNWFFLTP
jgi:hypothetical protein